MAQQSARRGWDNQGFPQCLEHATGDLDLVRELPYRPAAVFLPHQMRTDDSIRPRATAIPKFSLAWSGASTDGKRPLRFPARPCHSAGATSSLVAAGAIASNTPSRRTSAWNSAAATCIRIRAKNAKAR